MVKATLLYPAAIYNGDPLYTRNIFNRRFMQSDSSTQMQNAKSPEPPAIGVLTIIGKEMRAVKAALGMTEQDSVTRGDGTLFYEKVIVTNLSGPVRVVLWGIGSAGNTAAAADAASLIGRGIRFLILCGIAGGMRDKVKIGDLVIPRAVVDKSVKVIEDGELKARPVITGLLKGVEQMNAAIEISSEDLHKEFARLSPKLIEAPEGKEAEYKKHIAQTPSVHEAAILSDNLLVRDPSVIVDAANELHQQIRATEMEAGGFVHACNNVYPPIPWFLIRGISDFGDDFKNDLFHDHASKAVGAYLYLYVTRVVRLGIWDKLGPVEEPKPGNPTMFLEKIIAEVQSVGGPTTASRFPALNTAFMVTFAYLSQLSLPDARIDVNTRLQLSILWREAADEIKDVDPALYEICFKKSGYWIDPSRWDEQHIKLAGFSYSALLDRLKTLGFGKLPPANEWNFSVEHDEQSIKDHLLMESVAGQVVNMVAPAGMTDWEIRQLISETLNTPAVIEKVPAFLLGGITIRVNAALYRTWRSKHFITLDATALQQEVQNINSELPLGKCTIETPLKPSVWRKLNDAFEQAQTVGLDFEMPDASLCTIAGKIEKITEREQYAEGSVTAELVLNVETSDRLFSKYKITKRILCFCAPVENVKESVLDAFNRNGWTGSYKELSTGSLFSKRLQIRHGEADIDVSFQAVVNLASNGSKSVVKIDVSERQLFALTEQVADLADALAVSINKNLHGNAHE